MPFDCQPHLHTVAYHSSPGYHAFVPGAGVLCRSESDLLYGAGAYANSIKTESGERKITVYAAGGWEPLRLGPVKVGATLGLGTGYVYPLTPIGGLMASYKDVHLTFIPKIDGKTPMVVALSFTF